MIRALIIIAVAGFLMSVGCISAAVAIGGPEALARSAWSWNWDWDDGPRHWRHMSAGPFSANPSGPQSQRDFAFSGDRLEINAPAEIDYVQAPGPAKLTIRGSKSALDRVKVEGGRITLSPGRPFGPELHITLSAPDVTRFELNGANRLNIKGYKQDQLTLTASGAAEVEAQGETKTVKLDVSGHGDVDLTGLKTAGADIDISGAGAATVGPSEWARVDISGMGEVNLLTRPKRLNTNISGAGRVRQPDGDSAAGDDDDDDNERGPVRPT
jgi:hypothetical protein